MQEHKFNIECPPWALPREEIPLHVKIDKNITPNLKNIKIDLTDCFRLVDRINIARYEKTDNKIIVNEIGKAEKSNFDYFGIIIATKKPFSELKKEIPINIEFEYHNGTKETQVKNARIFRPQLDFESAPKEIILSDTSKAVPKIPIALKFMGFGEISLRIESKIGGKIVSVGTTLLDEILNRILSEGMVPSKEQNATVSVNQNYVENIVYQLKEKFRTDTHIQQMIKEGRIDKEIMEHIYELDRTDKEKLMTVFFKTVEGYLIKIISDTLTRNISNNLQIETSKISAQIKLPTTDVTIRLFYKDLLENEYDPVERTIQINDKRKNPSGFNVEIPLEISKVDESNAYKNVGTMRIGSSN